MRIKGSVGGVSLVNPRRISRGDELSAIDASSQRFSLSSRANRSLRYLMGCLSAPANKDELICQLLKRAEEEATSRDREMARKSGTDGSRIDCVHHPLIDADLEIGSVDVGGILPFTTTSKRVMLAWKRAMCHMRVVASDGAMPAVEDLAASIIWQVLWHGGNVVVFDSNDIANGPSTLLSKLNHKAPKIEHFPSMMSLYALEAAMMKDDEGRRTGDLLYVSGDAATSCDQDGYPLFFSMLKRNVANLLGMPVGSAGRVRDYQYRPKPFLVVVNNISADRVHSGQLATHMRALGSGLLFIDSAAEMQSEAAVGNISTTIHVEKHALAKGGERYLGTISQLGRGPMQEFIVAPVATERASF